MAITFQTREYILRLEECFLPSSCTLLLMTMFPILSGTMTLSCFSIYLNNLLLASLSRPMTAPGSSISAPGYYHASGYGMFSPATYSGAGFPQSFPRQSIPAELLSHFSNQPQPEAPPGSSSGPPGSSSGISQHPPGSANSAAIAASAALARDKIYGSRPYSGLPDEPSSAAHPRIPIASSSSSDNVFAHQPPPLSGGAIPPPSFGHLPGGGYHPAYRPGTDFHARRTLEDLDESRYSRPGTSETARPDTAYSTFSTQSGYSAAAALYQHLTHPSLYHTAGSIGVNDYGRPPTHHPTYNFIPIPSQPKKRPRRRFEEIERLYNCNYPGCNKAYGTLNHLNAHVSMQKHGPKRLPAGKLSQVRLVHTQPS